MVGHAYDSVTGDDEEGEEVTECSVEEEILDADDDFYHHQEQQLLQEQQQQLCREQQRQQQQFVQSEEENHHQQPYRAMEEMVAVDSESIVIDSEVTLAGAEIEVETMDGGEVEAEEVVGDDGGRIVGSKVVSGMKKTWGGKSPFGMLSSTGIDLMEEEEDDNEESDLSRFAHDHAYTFSKPTDEPSSSPR